MSENALRELLEMLDKTGAVFHLGPEHTIERRLAMLAKEGSEGEKEREELEAEHGQVWNISEVQAEFSVNSFLAPFCYVTRKSDGVRGTLRFRHMPRYYFGFKPE